MGYLTLPCQSSVRCDVVRGCHQYIWRLDKPLTASKSLCKLLLPDNSVGRFTCWLNAPQGFPPVIYVSLILVV